MEVDYSPSKDGDFPYCAVCGTIAKQKIVEKHSTFDVIKCGYCGKFYNW